MKTGSNVVNLLCFSCYLGFTGSNCSQYDCSGVKGCSGRGTCIQPNLCECSEGYEGESCSNFTCEEFNRCSGLYERLFLKKQYAFGRIFYKK